MSAVDIKALANSLTGWDEIAIQKAFRATFEDLPGMMGTRALLFIRARREGSSDKEAHTAAMSSTVGEIITLIGADEGDVPDPTESTRQTTSTEDTPIL